MPSIPIMIRREFDELLYSWLLRLSRANGFSHARSFINAYITPNASPSDKARRVPKYDLLEDFENIYNAADLNTDKQQLFLDTGVFPFYRVFMTEGQQSAVLSRTFRGSNSKDSVTETKMISKLRLCPECMKEELSQTGEFYYHREHQLPGVTICRIHKCALSSVKAVQLHELDPNPTMIPLKLDESALQYAEYCAELLHADADLNADILKKCMRGKAEEKWENDYDRFLSDCRQHYEKGYGWEIRARRFWNSLYSEYYLDPSLTVYCLMLLFPDPHEILKYADTASEPEELAAEINKLNCSLIRPYRKSIIELRHSCGYVFSVNPAELRSDWKCPICERNQNESDDAANGRISSRDEEVFRNEIRNLTGDEYTLVSHYTDMKHKVTIRHNICGRAQDYKPSAFLDGARCHYCNQMLRENQFKDAVSSISNGRYQITAKRTANLFAIQDQTDGKTHDMTAAKIMQELRRPTPSPILPLEQKGIEEEVHTQILDIRGWIEQNCPHGEPVFLDDIRQTKIDYAIMKNRVRDLCRKKHFLVPVAPGVYAYPDDHFTDEEVIRSHYIVRRGQHIGYPSGYSALHFLGITDKKPDRYYIVSNKETPTNTHGRTISFLGSRLKIYGSPIPVSDDNWQVFMLLGTAVNIKKYVHGEDVEKAFKVMAAYI